MSSSTFLFCDIFSSIPFPAFLLGLWIRLTLIFWFFIFLLSTMCRSFFLNNFLLLLHFCYFDLFYCISWKFWYLHRAFLSEKLSFYLFILEYDSSFLDCSSIFVLLEFGTYVITRPLEVAFFPQFVQEFCYVCCEVFEFLFYFYYSCLNYALFDFRKCGHIITCAHVGIIFRDYFL